MLQEGDQTRAEEGESSVVKRTSQKGKRLHVHARARAAALACELPPTLDVAILGGGASGLALAAALARRNPQLKIAVFEKSPILGKTILVTGNGRCNLTNTHLNARVYRNSDFVKDVFKKRPYEEIIDFFKALGVLCTVKDEDVGCVFPDTNLAESVRSPLVHALDACGVLKATLREVCGVEATSHGFLIRYLELFREDDGAPHEASVCAKHIVCATNCGEVVTPLQTLFDTHHVPYTPFEPVLVPLTLDSHCLDTLGPKAERVHAKLSLYDRSQRCLYEEVGDLMLSGTTVSGIAAFNASRYTDTCDSVAIELLPALSPEELSRLISSAMHNSSFVSVEDLLGVLSEPIAEALLADGPMSVEQFVAKRKVLHVRFVANDRSFSPQAKRGGVQPEAVFPETLELKNLPGAYVVGELLDCDGPCGGYNLSWAWISAMRAAEALQKAHVC